ncbi:DUF3306 domain-containing protein [Roseomonas sp. CECT 9278]|uniref:DUF3306 domain-containing protein n=1 Tax=Roseomonas sp. CECT 9278 TaxID=2845823 RepID=UPI001E397AA9|nr:DUF3306 domain-containing protein [Roseomonas sp. CECT 9278]CAH0166016.1 hypothetical protein ROS9278_01079 [Roseomonas sp. CECT 9278]
MSGEDGFLSRWSRRKRAIEAGRPLPEPEAAAPPPAPPPPAAAVPEEPPFDITTLPPIDSLTLASDFTAFLRKEVPAALQRAALRRAWSLDPAIRDFVGPADYAWDYNAPDGVPGGSLELVGDVREMLAQVFGPEPDAKDGASEGSGAVAPEGARDASAPEGARDASVPEGARDASVPAGALAQATPEGALAQATPEGALARIARDRVLAPDTAAREVAGDAPDGVLADVPARPSPRLPQPHDAPMLPPALLADAPAPAPRRPTAEAAPAAPHPRRHGSALPS